MEGFHADLEGLTYSLDPGFGVMVQNSPIPMAGVEGEKPLLLEGF
jgi:hypothetical protein